jgi:hypothetical protein
VQATVILEEISQYVNDAGEGKKKKKTSVRILGIKSGPLEHKA